MAEYNFTTLSSREFEILSRDLLQAELSIRLETFTAGPDKGIDARWSNGTSEEIVVQCKHYANSGYRPLLRVLSKEKDKIQSRKQLRYILTTSVGLTPLNKDEILQVLHPYCRFTADIYGRDDINNLLTRHPHIEQQNFKLWLTSEAVLTRMLNAGVLNDSDSTLDKARNKVRRYVQNGSYNRALTILEQHKFCVIAGLPGIGKTTLAEVLLAHYVDKCSYSVYRIREDISEIKAIKRCDCKQVFYYDDFLGKLLCI
ncbi:MULTISPECIES: restriction endonuclease [Cyanophyceae]|uniref:nSTAND3 domain-containing NTPase n=1 Tax=Cyanophyceae TaxID=3028117 RepID=UPI0016844605|nr:restriction endonuclease [Trichocoleus sp. FACHB-40]MBD2005094.1 restriction endonuclease [Trichocoleus sp. FACHB-40]